MFLNSNMASQDKLLLLLLEPFVIQFDFWIVELLTMSVLNWTFSPFRMTTKVKEKLTVGNGSQLNISHIGSTSILLKPNFRNSNFLKGSLNFFFD